MPLHTLCSRVCFLLHFSFFCLFFWFRLLMPHLHSYLCVCVCSRLLFLLSLFRSLFQAPIIAGPHVTATAGTGLVHAAPGHGVEDFFACALVMVVVVMMMTMMTMMMMIVMIAGTGLYLFHISVF